MPGTKRRFVKGWGGNSLQSSSSKYHSIVPTSFSFIILGNKINEIKTKQSTSILALCYTCMIVKSCFLFSTQLLLSFLMASSSLKSIHPTHSFMHFTYSFSHLRDLTQKDWGLEKKFSYLLQTLCPVVLCLHSFTVRRSIFLKDL